MSPSRYLLPTQRRRVPPDPTAPAADDELRAHVERVLAAHYELDCEIGRGGMGIVYRARDRRLKRQVAIKLLPPELAFRSEIKTRFLREAETAAQLSHPNIVPIYAVDEIESLVFFVMAYVSGDNLAKRLHERGVLTIDETRRVLHDVADALAYAHDRGVVHRDIKPDNILLDGLSGRPMVTDFGIARAMDSAGDSRLTATGMAIGTPAYMSPEQAAGEREIDGRSDLYSLGILGYQMLTGEPPFSAGSTPAMLVKHISERPVPVGQRRAEVPADLGRCVMMLLEKDPDNRFPSASALVAALETRVAPAERAPAPARAPATGYAPGRAPADGPYDAAPQLRGTRQPVPYAVDPHAPAPATSEELRRWEAAPVMAFRRKIAPYLFVNGVIVLFSLVGHGGFLFVSLIWSIVVASRYAKLWSEGYDWRDVFRQPREKELMEVCEEAVDYLRALMDPAGRARLRAERVQRRLALRIGLAAPRGGFALPEPAPAGHGVAPAAAPRLLPGPLDDRMRQALADRDEIVRRLDALQGSLGKGHRDDVAHAASELADRVQHFAMQLDDVERQDLTGARAQLEAEITRLEAAANPLERGSEDRVRRLALLKRQRRGLVDAGARRDQAAARLETCALALQNMRFDLLRLGAAPQMHQQVTSLANQAIRLADSVDDAVHVADEMRRLDVARATPGARRVSERG